MCATLTQTWAFTTIYPHSRTPYDGVTANTKDDKIRMQMALQIALVVLRTH